MAQEEHPENAPTPPVVDRRSFDALVEELEPLREVTYPAFTVHMDVATLYDLTEGNIDKMVELAAKMRAVMLP